MKCWQEGQEDQMKPNTKFVTAASVIVMGAGLLASSFTGVAYGTPNTGNAEELLDQRVTAAMDGQPSVTQCGPDAQAKQSVGTSTGQALATLGDSATDQLTVAKVPADAQVVLGTINPNAANAVQASETCRRWGCGPCLSNWNPGTPHYGLSRVCNLTCTGTFNYTLYHQRLAGC
jgi:hypothetical protein